MNRWEDTDADTNVASDTDAVDTADANADVTTDADADNDADADAVTLSSNNRSYIRRSVLSSLGMSFYLWYLPPPPVACNETGC